MKTIALSIIVLISFNLFGQENTLNDKNKVNVGFGMNFGNFNTGTLSMQFYRKNSFSIDYGIVSGTRVARQKPPGFKAGQTELWGMTIKHGTPTDRYLSQYLMLGKGFSTKNNKFNLITKIGFSQNKFHKSKNFKPKTSSSGSTHGYSKVYYSNFGFMSEIEAQFALSNGFGISFSPNMNLNRHESIFGFRVKLLIGKLK